MHSHTSDDMNRFNGSPHDLQWHLRTMHGPWPDTIRVADLDAHVLRQLHWAARHENPYADHEEQARDMAERLRTRHTSDPLTVFSRRGTLHATFRMGPVGQIPGGASIVMTDQADMGKYVLEIRALPGKDC